MLKTAELYSAIQGYERPDYVANADKSTVADYQHKAAGESSFPLHTRAALWFSAARLLEKRASLPAEDFDYWAKQIEDRALFFGTEDDIEKLTRKYAEEVVASEPKQSDSNEDYAYVLKTDEGEIRRYPIAKKADITAAAGYIEKNRDKFTLPERRMMARRIMLKAAKVGVQFPQNTLYFLEKTAGQGTCSTDTAAELLRERGEIWAKKLGPEAKAGLAKLAEEIKHAPYCKIGEASYERDKLAEFIDRYDEEFEVKHRYDKDVRRPEEVLFSITQSKVAEARSDAVQTQSGEIYSKEDLHRLDFDKVAEALGEAFAEACQEDGVFSHNKLAELIPTLPRTEVRYLKEALDSLGIDKVAQVRATLPRLSAADWLALAQEG